MYIPLMMGLGLLSLAALSWVHFLLLRRNGRMVTAEVVWLPGKERVNRKEMARIMSDKELRRLHRYSMLVRYYPPGAESLEFGVSTGRQLPGLKLGDQIQVLYDPSKPTSAVLPEENLWVGPLLLAIAGLFITIPSLLSLWQ